LGFSSEEEFEAEKIKQRQKAQERGDKISPDERTFFQKKRSELRAAVETPSVLTGTTPAGRARQAARGAVTGARVGGSLAFPLLSPAIEATGEFAASKLADEPTKKALKDAAAAGLISLSTLGALGIASKGAKGILNFSTKKFAPLSQKAKDFIKEKPQVLSPIQKSVEDIVDTAIDGIKGVRKKAGELVARSKKLGSNDVKLDLSVLSQRLDDQILDRSLGKKTILKRKSPILGPGGEALETAVPSKRVKVSAGIEGKKALDLIQRSLDGKKTYPEILKSTDELSNQKAIRRIFDRVNDGVQISSAEQLAIQTLDDFKNLAYDRMDDIMLREGLIKAKGEYSTIKKAINQLRRLDNERLVGRMTQGLKEGRGRVFESMQFLDGLVPQQSKFLDDFVRSKVGGAAHELRGLGLSDLVQKGLVTTAQAGVGTPGRLAGAAVQRGLVDQLTEPVSEQLEPAARSLLRRVNQ
jgi:hypothetical protein